MLAARTLEGKPVTFTQDEDRLAIHIAAADTDTPVTVVALELDAEIPSKTFIPLLSSMPDDMSEYGEIISEAATLEVSSVSAHDHVEDHPRLFRGERSERGYAFCTAGEENPWVKIDLGDVKNVKAVVIENRQNDRGSDGLILSVSEDGEQWSEVWQAEELEDSWCAVVTRFHAGIEVPGRSVRYLKLETRGEKARSLLLQRVTVYGE